VKPRAETSAALVRCPSWKLQGDNDDNIQEMSGGCGAGFRRPHGDGSGPGGAAADRRSDARGGRPGRSNRERSVLLARSALLLVLGWLAWSRLVLVRLFLAARLRLGRRLWLARLASPRMARPSTLARTAGLARSATGCASRYPRRPAWDAGSGGAWRSTLRNAIGYGRQPPHGRWQPGRHAVGYGRRHEVRRRWRPRRRRRPRSITPEIHLRI
jgi:hypothetical protein